MKRILVISATLVAALALGGSAQAKAKAGSSKQSKGKIVSITQDKTDATLTDIVIETGGKKNPKEITLTANNTTAVTLDGAAVQLSVLAPGEKVKFSPSTTGLATTLAATSKGHHKKSAKPAPAPAAVAPATAPSQL